MSSRCKVWWNGTPFVEEAVFAKRFFATDIDYYGSNCCESLRLNTYARLQLKRLCAMFTDELKVGTSSSFRNQVLGFQFEIAAGRCYKTGCREVRHARGGLSKSRLNYIKKNCVDSANLKRIFHVENGKNGTQPFNLDVTLNNQRIPNVVDLIYNSYVRVWPAKERQRGVRSAGQRQPLSQSNPQNRLENSSGNPERPAWAF